MSALEKTQIQLGYIPLLDCIALLWAKHRGYFEEQGLEVTLVKEASWASLRDRLAFGLLDAAHCLSGILPAALIGTDHIGIPFQTPLVLSVNRAYISLSQKLCFELNIQPEQSPADVAQKVVGAIQQGKDIQLAHVFANSIHHFCIREWLALANAEVAHALKLRILPPPYMVEALNNHAIDGFCVGEPWNTQGEILGISQIVASSQDVIPAIADKVLAVTADWASTHPNTLQAMTQAISKAQNEIKTMQDFSQIWELLQAYDVIQFECSDTVHVQKFYKIQNIIRNFIEDSASPKVEDFAWLIQQMQKWSKLQVHDAELKNLSQQCIIQL